MQITAAALLAFVAAVAAGDATYGFDTITNPAVDYNTYTTGDTFDITWEYNDQYPGTVTITLIGGTDPSNLGDILTIAAGVDNSLGTYTWTLGSDASQNTYGYRINWDTDMEIFQWSHPFHLVAGGSYPLTTMTTTPSSPSSTSGAVQSDGQADQGQLPSTTLATSVTANGTTAHNTQPTGVTVPSQQAQSQPQQSANISITAVPTKPSETGSSSAEATGVVEAGASSAAVGAFGLIAGLAAAFLTL